MYGPGTGDEIIPGWYDEFGDGKSIFLSFNSSMFLLCSTHLFCYLYLQVVDGTRNMFQRDVHRVAAMLVLKE